MANQTIEVMKHLIIPCLFLIFPCLLAGQDFAYMEKKEIKDLNSFIYDARFSPFRNYFAVAYGDNRLELYDRNWRKIYEHQGNEKSNAGDLVFSPDEEYLAFSRYKGASDIAILRLDDLKVISVLTENSDFVMDICFSHSGQLFASADAEGNLCIWDGHNEIYEHIGTLDAQFYNNASISFSFDDRFLAAAGGRNMVRIYEFKNGKINLVDTCAASPPSVNRVVFHPTEMKMVTRTSDYMYLWERNGPRFSILDSLKMFSYASNGLAFSPMGDYLVSGSSKEARIFKVEGGKINEVTSITRHSLGGEDGQVFRVGFSEDGQFLVTSSLDKSAIIWEVSGVRPSLRSTIAGYLNNTMTLAQKRVLNGPLLERINNKLPPGLKAPKDEFETTEQYDQRRQKLAETTLLYVQEQIEKAYGVRPGPGSNVRFPVQELVGYNADRQIYKVRFLEPEGGVDIPIEPARALKGAWESATIQVWKFRDPNAVAYDYSDFQLVHPTNGRTYPVAPLENPFLLKSGPEQMKSDMAIRKPQPAEKPVGSEHRITRALLFATDVYDSFSELTNPLLDANTMAAELAMNYGTMVEVVENPTLQETMKKIREYATYSYDEGDQLLVFFAGHGIYDEVFKEGYVISRDSQDDDDTRTSYLSHSNLRTIINNIPCRHIFLVMDVCFGGTFDPTLASSTRGAEMYEEITVEDFIERKSRYKTRLYLTSGGKEYVPDGRPGHHSPFMRKFLEALRTYGGADGLTTVSDILKYVERVDPQPRFGEFGDNEPGSDFLLILKNGSIR